MFDIDGVVGPFDDDVSDLVVLFFFGA